MQKCTFHSLTTRITEHSVHKIKHHQLDNFSFTAKVQCHTLFKDVCSRYIDSQTLQINLRCDFFKAHPRLVQTRMSFPISPLQIRQTVTSSSLITQYTNAYFVSFAVSSNLESNFQRVVQM